MSEQFAHTEVYVETKMFKIVSLVIAFNSFVGLPAMAQDADSSPYSFSGPCSSQGAWTRAALAHTSELKQVITKLKDNPACNSLKSGIESSLTAMEQSISESQRINNSTNDKTRRLSQLPKEIGALRTFSRENSVFRNDVLQLLLGKTVAQSALSAQLAGDQKTGGSGLNDADSSTSLAALSARASDASLTGLQFFNSTLTSFQQAQAGCLDDTQGVAITAGLIKVLASFASSGNNSMNNQLVMAVQNLGQYLGREKKYVDALRQLNNIEFKNSMSCLMEITTDGYCSVLDAQYLFAEITNSQSVKFQDVKNTRTGQVEKKIVGLNETFNKKLENGPLAGYYILSRQVPIVTNWLQKVQYGITPQLPTEATFQIDVSTNVYQHYNTLKRIEGTFNFQRKLLGELNDFKSKQTYVLQMLKSVAGFMTNGGDGENFFAKVSSPNEIYFRLMGMNTVPDAVLGTGPEGMQFGNNPSGWLQAKYRTLPIFNDPDKLAEIISNNMQGLFKEATSMAIAYYNKYFIVDKIQVANDSLLGLDANVRDALVNIDAYLAHLEIRMTKDSKDTSLVAGIQETRLHIGNVLKRYRELHDYSAELVRNGNSDPELEKKLAKLGDNLLQTVYTEFQVLAARTGYLSNRMATFVAKDYEISLRSRDTFDPYFEDLMLATGFTTLNTMTNMSQTEFSKVKTDLDQSMNIYKGNIDALEGIVASVFVRNIFDLKLSASNEEITEVERYRMAYEMAKEMGNVQIPGEDSAAWQRYLRGYLKTAWMGASGQDRELLGTPSLMTRATFPFKQFGNWVMGQKGKIVVSPVSEFETARGEMAKLCTQSLSFANLRTYWALCKDVQLDSPLLKKDLTDPELKKLMNTYMSVNFSNKAYQYIERDKKNITGTDRARNYQARICALRDYHRRNEIARMTSAMRNDGASYTNPFMESIETPLEKAAPTAAAAAPAQK